MNRLLDEQQEAKSTIANAFREIKELEATISHKVEIQRGKIRDARIRLEEELAELFTSVSLEDFMDVDSARVLYSLGWNNGFGSNAFSDLVHRVTKGTYLTKYFSSWCHSEDKKNTAFSWAVAIPAASRVDEDTLLRTAESVAQLYRVVEEILGEENCAFEVFEDSTDATGSWKLSHEDGEWVVAERYYERVYENYSHPELIEVFRWMASNVWYSGDVSQITS